MPTHRISNWETWKELCEQNNLDPCKTIEFGLDMGGGDSLDYEFIGDIPKICGNCLNCEEQVGGDGYCFMLRAGVYLDESCPQNSFVPKEE